MRTRLLLGPMAGLSTQGEAQNLIANGNFDTDLTGWITADGLPDDRRYWVEDDVASSALSGSVELVNVGQGNNAFRRTIQQCLSVEPDAVYLYSSWGKAPAEQPGNDGVILSILVNRTADCSGPISGSYTSFGITPDDTWQPMSGSFETFSDSQSILVSLAIGKQTGFRDDVTARFDAVAVEPDKIVADDFENRKAE